MDSSLRYTAGQDTPMPDTYFDFSETNGIHVLQKCVTDQGCRKTEKSGNFTCVQVIWQHVMAYHRARANMLQNNNSDTVKFDSEALLEVLDCVLCKGCKSECPCRYGEAKMKLYNSIMIKKMV
jgi:hypothetical protein